MQNLKLEVVASDNEWVVRDGSGTSIPFADGITIPTATESPLRATRIATAGAGAAGRCPCS